MKQAVGVPDAPGAAGAYSRETTDDATLYTAGQIPLTPDGDLLGDGPVDIQTRECLENVRAVREEGGVTLGEVRTVTVYRADIDDFETMDDASGEETVENPPARRVVGGVDLPRGVAVEIAAVAAVE